MPGDDAGAVSTDGDARPRHFHFLLLEVWVS